MRRPHQNLATGALIISSLLLLWLLTYSAATRGWAVRRRPTYQASPNITAELEAENFRLQADLQAAKDQLNLNFANQIQNGGEEVEKIQDEDGRMQGSSQRHSFAYVFYATTSPYACSVLVSIHRLKELGSIYPIYILLTPTVSARYKQAFEAAGAKIYIQEAPPLKDNNAGYYKDCMLKLLAFKMQEMEPHLKRVMSFDSDQLVMRNLDPLFAGLPDVDLAAPRAYWLAKDFLTSTFLIIDLSERLWRTVKSALDSVGYDKFDMDLINDLLGDTVMMLSGEYVTMNSHWEDWNLPKWYHPQAELNMTSIEKWNEVVKSGGVKARDVGDGQDHADGSPSPNAPFSATIDAPAQLMPGSRHNGIEEQKAPPPPPIPSSNPRFPDSHPLSIELDRLQDAAAVIHFSAVGKPWIKTHADIRMQRPDAHPLLAEQFALWREIAQEVCPGGIP
ncbi:hypothetical protein LTR78_010908 [Recurvomyces mirabilis]|uniref:Nucleotide-diphospho-sugar transferase n=1 Tax=Recurvomyces mirabilis TaxID=574656 RepID=A0AAE0TR84_9PEZI|nr:hypothetical protein LTR78_010908 [Recurvomyces mirabilis]KAK5149907.1 hypothetical protein LTS14_010512 [Recurvomyces mirabilis]